MTVSHPLVSAGTNGTALVLHGAGAWVCDLTLPVHSQKSSAEGPWGDADGESNGRRNTASSGWKVEWERPCRMLCGTSGHTDTGWLCRHRASCASGSGHQMPSEAEDQTLRVATMSLACTQFVLQIEALIYTASTRCDILKLPRRWEGCFWTLQTTLVSPVRRPLCFSRALSTDVFI